MFFYILMVPVLLALAWEAYVLRAMRRYDHYLFNFCQVRRGAMFYLRKNYKSLTREDYIALRKLIHCNNGIIENYRQHRIRIFDLRKFVEYIQATKRTTEAVERVKSNNPKIKEIHDTLSYWIVRSFIEFTPLVGPTVFKQRLRSLLAKAAKSTMLIKFKLVRRYYSALIEANRFVEGQSGVLDHYRRHRECSV